MKLVSGCIPILVSAMALAMDVMAAPDSNPQKAITANAAISPASLGRQVTERVISKLAPGRVSTFTVSPDGRHVAYWAYVNGKPDIVSEEGEGGKIVVMVDGRKNSESYDSDETFKPILKLIFSPDSRSLAYLVGHSGGYVYIDELEEEDYGYDIVGNMDDNWFRFSPDSKSAIYVISANNVDGPAYVVTNGRRSEPYSRLAGPPIFSPDSRHLAFAVRINRPYAVYMVADGQEGKHYDEYDYRYTTFSPDSSKLAYIAGAGQPSGPQRHMEYFVVVNGQEGKHYAGIGNYLRFSPDSQHLLYPAKIAENKWTVVVDGKEGGVHDAWAIFNPAFSPDSKHVAYAAWIKPDKGDWYVVIDGQEGKRYKRIHDYVHFSSDSKHTAYSACDGSSCFIVVDGQEGKHHEFASQITYSPVGAKFAYVAMLGSKQFVVNDGREGKLYDNITNLVFSPDGKYIAYAAYSKRTKKWFVVVNAQEGKSYNFVMARSATEEEGRIDKSIETGSLQFDSPDRLHYLAVSNKRILLVEEQLSTPESNTAFK